MCFISVTNHIKVKVARYFFQFELSVTKTAVSSTEILQLVIIGVAIECYKLIQQNNYLVCEESFAAKQCTLFEKN